MKKKSKIFGFIFGVLISFAITFWTMHIVYTLKTNSMYEDMQLMYKSGYYSGAVVFKKSEDRVEFDEYFKEDSAILFEKYKY